MQVDKNQMILNSPEILSEYSDFKLFARHLSDISAQVIRKYFRTDLRVEEKHDRSPVTIADKKAEELMSEAIIKTFSEHGIIGEEFGEQNKQAEYTWVLDPIDGTKNFICGAIGFGTLIALLKNGNPIIGVFNQPILDEFLLGDNDKTLINGKITSIRHCDSLDKAYLLTTDHLDNEKYQNAQGFNKLIREVKIYRNWGDCYGYYLLSTGFTDIMLDPKVSFWDIAALVPIVKGAGGIITDYHGNDPLNGNSLIAANPKLHPEVVARLK